MGFYAFLAAGCTAGALLCAPLQARADDPYPPRGYQIDVGPLHVDTATGAIWYDTSPFDYPEYLDPGPDNFSLTFRVNGIDYRYDYHPGRTEGYRWDPRYAPYLYYGSGYGHYRRR